METPDVRRERLQAQLEKAVGSGQLLIQEYEKLMGLLWSEEATEDDTLANLDRVAGRVDRLEREAPAPQAAAPTGPPALVHQPGSGVTSLAQQDGQASIMSTIKRNGRWGLKPATTWWNVMGETEIDLREAQWPNDTITLNLQGFFSDYRIIVPPGTQVIDSSSNFFSEFTQKNQASSKKRSTRVYTEDNPYGPGGAGDVARRGDGLTVIIDGFHLFSEVKIRYR